MLMQGFGLRICNGGAQAAAYNGYLMHALKLCGRAKRANKIMQAIAYIHFGQKLGRSAGRLEDDGYRSFFTVVATNGQRHALANFTHTQNDELTRLRFSSDKRRVDLHHRGYRVECSFADNFVHREHHSFL